MGLVHRVEQGIEAAQQHHDADGDHQVQQQRMQPRGQMRHIRQADLQHQPWHGLREPAQHFVMQQDVGPVRRHAQSHPARHALQQELRQIAAGNRQQRQQGQAGGGLHPWLEFGNQ